MRFKKGMALMLALIMLMSFGSFSGAESAAADAIVNLKTEGMVHPLGVNTDTPSFSWQMRSGRTGAAQSSWQIQLWDAQDRMVWDSGEKADSASVGIPYGGEPLQARSAYTWQVTVTNDLGEKLVSEKAGFETSLLSDSFDAWNGARWIGAGALPLDAASKAVFHIQAKVQLAEGSDRASFILGADDFRLRNEAFNNQLVAGENWVRVELDLREDPDTGAARFHVYRRGYAAADDPAGSPVYTSKPSEEMDTAALAVGKYGIHEVDISCNAEGLTLSLDGVALSTDIAVVNATGSDNTYPNLNGVGFAMNPGESAVFTGYRITNGGKYSSATLLDEHTGATTGIFKGLEGVAVEGNVISVSGGESGVLSWADPSWDSAPMLRTAFSAKEGIAKAQASRRRNRSRASLASQIAEAAIEDPLTREELKAMVNSMHE